MTDWAKFIQAKMRLARQGGKPVPPRDGARVPPGQREVDNFPVLDLGNRPRIPLKDWRLRVYGLVTRELCLTWENLQSFTQTRLVLDFHCVTRWSRLDMEWEGVLAKDVLALAGPLPAGAYATIYGYDGYTTNLPLGALLDDDVLIACRVFGKALAVDHGGPVRLMVPKRYGWKSAKWLKAIEIHEQDRPGFWELRGYHNEADPWKEQRFGYPVHTKE